MNLLAEFVGELCKILLPVREQTFYGDPNSNVAICTLAGINDLRQITKSSILNEVSVAGRLFTENEGIDTLVNYVLANEKIDTVVLCGNDTSGHKSGQALLCLYKNGIDANQRIIGSDSPNPFLTLTQKQITKFQKQVKLVDKIGLEDISKIKNIVLENKKAQ